MAVPEDRAAFVLELFEGLGALSTRRMMGGLCLYSDGTIFAILRSDGVVLLKGAGVAAAAMERDGWTRWRHERADGRVQSMPYWVMPADLLDDPEAACDRARVALAALR